MKKKIKPNENDIIYINHKPGDPLNGSATTIPIKGEGWTSEIFISADYFKRVLDYLKEGLDDTEKNQ